MVLPFHSEEGLALTFYFIPEPSFKESFNEQNSNGVNSESDLKGIAFTEAKPFTQEKLNDLIRDFELSK